jgi:(p)ppGpp synthase/HD superfamily hydrolase
MATIEKALQIAAKAHEVQKDKSGLPYILHPLRVMQKV